MTQPELIPEWYFYSVVFILGLLVGSFLNVVIYRTPKVLERNWLAECKAFLAQYDTENAEQPPPSQLPAENENKHAPYFPHAPHFSIVWPRSHCPSCNAPIRPWHNIPVLGFLMLKGRCADCGWSISLRYPLVESFTGLISVLVAHQFGFGIETALALVLTYSLIALAGIDFDTQLLPDDITLPLMWLGLVVNYFSVFVSFDEAFWGAVIGYLSLWSVFWLFKLVTGKDGMGYGDFKLLAALGAWLGWKVLAMIVLMASVSGLIAAILMMVLLSHDRRMPIAFGPYLAAGGWLTLVYASQIQHLIPIFSF